MANEQDRNQNPTTGSESDVSKAQSQQQPPQQASQRQPETSQESEQETGLDPSANSPDEGQQGETLAKQHTDVEGSSLGKEERGEAESGFVGSEGRQDTSSELVEDEESEGDEGTAEGK